MRRGLWFIAGAGAGIYAVIRGRRAAEALTIDGLQDRLNGLAVGARLFREEVAEGRAEKETELREKFAVRPHGRHELGTAEGSEVSRLVAGAPRTSTTEDHEKEGRG
jgi:hypothetical protein